MLTDISLIFSFIFVKIIFGIFAHFYFYFLYFKIFYCLCYYSCPNCPPLPPSTQPALHFHSQSQHHCPYPWPLHICSLANPFTYQSVPSSSLPSYSCQSIPWFYASGSILLISLFYSLDSFYKWDYMVFVFYQLSYSISIIVSSSIHAVQKGRNSFFLLHSIPLCTLIYGWAPRLFPNLGYYK